MSCKAMPPRWGSALIGDGVYKHVAPPELAIESIPLIQWQRVPGLGEGTQIPPTQESRTQFSSRGSSICGRSLSHEARQMRSWCHGRPRT